MYLHTFGGSALLHLLMGYPRLILTLGIAATVVALSAPHGPGRYVGTERHLARLDAAIVEASGDQAGREEQAARLAATALELSTADEIEVAVAYTLRQCGPGCTDLSTPIVTGDPDLLEGVLTLYYLDQLQRGTRAGGQTDGASGVRAGG